MPRERDQMGQQWMHDETRSDGFTVLCLACGHRWAAPDAGVRSSRAAEPKNPYTAGVAAENWRRGFNGERLIAAPGSTAERYYNEGKAARKAHDAGVQEPIPPNVYWAPLADNFYSAEGGGMGNDFYRKWKPRRAEFPQGESAGWGKGSAHNPFKDAPRTSSGVPKDEGQSK
jgi:hypothetical protein